MRILALLAALSAFQGLADTEVGPAIYVNYRVNSQSFITQLHWAETPTPTEIARTVSFAFNHWTAYGGSRYIARSLGETTQTDGTAGDYIVAAKHSTAAPGDFLTIAVNDQGARSITVYSRDPLPGGAHGPTRYTLLPRISANQTFDLTTTLVHEWGHTVMIGIGQDGKGHLWTWDGTDPCVMEPALNGERFDGFCDKEIRVVGRPQSWMNLTSGFLVTGVKTSTTAGPTPSSWPAPMATSVFSGIGGATLVYGPDFWNPSTEWQLLIRTTAQVPTPPPFAPPAPQPHPSTLMPPNGAWSANVIPNAIQRPSVVYDPQRNAWWVVVRQGGSTQHRLYKNTPGVSGWQDFGVISHGSTGVRSRLPVGLAFDFRSGNLVVVWTSSEGEPYQLTESGNIPAGNNASSNANGSGCDANSATLGPNWLRHCRGEVLAGVLVPEGNGTGHLLSSVQRFQPSSVKGRWGYTGSGAPAIVCDPGTSYLSLQCEIYVTDVTQFKSISNWRVCVNGASFCGYSLPYTERSASTGETDYPVALTTRRADGSGRILEAVTGTDRRIYFRSKPSVADAFGAWPLLSTLESGGPPSAVRSNITDTYTIAFPGIP